MSSKRSRVRVKLALPDDWVAEVRRLITRGRSDRELAKAIGIGNSTIHRFWNGDASWDTAVKMAAEAGIAPPLLVNPRSGAGRLERIRRTDSEEYARRLDALFGDDPLPDAEPPRSRAKENSGDPRR